MSSKNLNTLMKHKDKIKSSGSTEDRTSLILSLVRKNSHSCVDNYLDLDMHEKGDVTNRDIQAREKLLKEVEQHQKAVQYALRTGKINRSR